MVEAMHFSLQCTTAPEGNDNAAERCEFTIDLPLARRIIALAGVVAAHGLFEVVVHDLEPSWLLAADDIEDEENEDEGEGEGSPEPTVEPIDTECDGLCVTRDHFNFTAFWRHTDVRYTSEPVLIADLAQHFGLDRDGEERAAEASLPAKEQRASELLERFVASSGQGQGEDGEAMAALLADLRLLADRKHVDFFAALDRSYPAYLESRMG